MEFFERAHVTRKDSFKKGNKSGEALKKQLKQMLHAYKKGNNQEIKSCAEKEIKYDLDDIKSMSEFSDYSIQKHADASLNTATSGDGEEPQSSSSNEHSLTKSNMSDSDHEGIEDGLESLTERDFKSQSSPQDISSTDKDLSTSFDNSSMSEECSDDSEISIPSSLQSLTSTESDISDEDMFDPDGALASKILDRLGSKHSTSQNRKLSKDKDVDNKAVMKKEKQNKTMKTNKKEKQNTTSKSDEIHTRAFRELDIKDVDSLSSRNTQNETTSGNDNDVDNTSVSSNNSMPFVSVSAVDMQSQSLSDVVGNYMHPTIKNLPSQNQHVVYTPSSKYAILDEVMSGEITEDISSIIPEIDEELDELTIDSEPPEPVVENIDSVDLDTLTDDVEKQSSIKIYNGRNNYILVMKHPAELYIHGKVQVTALGGSVTILGYTLHNETIDVFSPYCYMAHCIQTMEHENVFHSLFGKLTSAGLTSLEAEEVVISITKHDAVICLNSLDCAKIDFVDNHFAVTELFTKKGEHNADFLRKASENLGCSLYLNRPKRFFAPNSDWEHVIECGMSHESRGIVCGGKGVGKSTFLRYYINRLLANGPVLVIDLDPGQAEFTVPGNISVSVVNKPLVGPNFTHLKKPERTLKIGMINPMDNPSRYISSVKELINYCHNNEAYESLPWIVNTMGMCNNIGLKFIICIVLQYKPTFLLQIDSKVAKKRFEHELDPATLKVIYEEYVNDYLLAGIDPPFFLDYRYIKTVHSESGSTQKGCFTLSPRDERYLNVLAYFSELLDVYSGKGILDIVPYEVNIHDLNIGANISIQEEFLTKVINGKIIALCQLTTTDKGKMFTLDDNALLCHGYGLIRGIDFKREILYILTPLAVEDLNMVNALVYSDWMPELHGLDSELPDGTIVPYRIPTSEQRSTMMHSPRRRFNPLQLLKVTRST